MTHHTAPTRIHHLLDHNAAVRPNAPAIKDCDGRVYSWAEYAKLTEDAARLLAERKAHFVDGFHGPRGTSEAATAHVCLFKIPHDQ